MKKRVRSGKNSCFKKIIESSWQDVGETLEDIRIQNYSKSHQLCPSERKRLQFPFLSHLLRERLYDDHLDKKGNFSPLKSERVETIYSTDVVNVYCGEIVDSCRLRSLTSRCLEVIADNLDRYEPNYVSEVLYLLPTEYTTALSAMACRRGTINDDNIVCFVNSNSEFLVLGGPLLGNDGIKRVFPRVTRVYDDNNAVDSWEELIDLTDDCRMMSVCGCINLRRISILSPRITASVLYQLAELPTSKVQRLDVHGRCSLPVMTSNCTDEMQSFDVAMLRDTKYENIDIESIF